MAFKEVLFLKSKTLALLKKRRHQDNVSNQMRGLVIYVLMKADAFLFAKTTPGNAKNIVLEIKKRFYARNMLE